VALGTKTYGFEGTDTQGTLQEVVIAKKRKKELLVIQMCEQYESLEVRMCEQMCEQYESLEVRIVSNSMYSEPAPKQGHTRASSLSGCICLIHNTD
jgi:hypothetical protein